jgi:hypothetical protein
MRLFYKSRDSVAKSREIYRVLNRGESVHTLHSVMMLRGGAKHCMVEGAKEQGDERECRNHSGPAA